MEDTSHMLGIMASLFSNLASESQARIRLLAKYVEGNYEKVDRLLEIREHSESRLKAAEKDIEQERRVSQLCCILKSCIQSLETFQDLVADGVVVGGEEEDTWYLRRLDSGLFVLQTVDYILGWICMEDDGVCNCFLATI